jgi:hypothetical protein
MNFDRSDLFLEPKVTQYGSHMVMSNINKPLKKKIYSLDTKFRDDYEEYSKINPSFYTISIPQRINDVKSIAVMNIEIPLTFYNISSSLENNTFEVVSGGVSKTIIIPDGQYDSVGLITVVNNELLLVGFSGLVFNIIGFTSNFSTSTGSYTIKFAVKSTMTSSGTSLNTDFNKFNFKSRLGWILGFRTIQYVVSSGSTAVSESFIDLNGPRYLYLVIDDFTQSNPNSFIVPSSTSFLNNNIIAKISLDRAFYNFGKIYVANDSNYWLCGDKRVYTGKVDLQRLKVQLVNEIGLPINLNGLDFSFGLEIEYE